MQCRGRNFLLARELMNESLGIYKTDKTRAIRREGHTRHAASPVADKNVHGSSHVITHEHMVNMLDLKLFSGECSSGGVVKYVRQHTPVLVKDRKHVYDVTTVTRTFELWLRFSSVTCLCATCLGQNLLTLLLS